MKPWLDAAMLRERLADGNLRLVDVRYSLSDPHAGLRAYRAGHLPGAIYLDLERELSGQVGVHGGRHPLPDPSQFAAMLGLMGIGNDSQVVAYDEGSNMLAGRLWWLLRWLGHERVQVLDGGAQAWLGPWTTEPASYPPTYFTPALRPEMVVDRDWLLLHGRDPGVVVVDARSGERYRGEVEPIDPRGGHIPGAVNLPFVDNLDGLYFRPLRELAERWSEHRDADTLVVYCGSGVSAAHQLMVLEALGVRGAKLYPGSWSDWVSYPDSPVALGATPEGDELLQVTQAELVG
jgi:thiosulfate/3-mercaptopyruvate sulfurtransferase